MATNAESPGPGYGNKEDEGRPQGRRHDSTPGTPRRPPPPEGLPEKLSPDTAFPESVNKHGTLCTDEATWWLLYDGRISAEQREELARHRAKCVRCRAVWNEICSLGELLSGPAPDRARAQELSGRALGIHLQRLWRRRVRRGLAMAAGFILVLGLAARLFSLPPFDGPATSGTDLLAGGKGAGERPEGRKPHDGDASTQGQAKVRQPGVATPDTPIVHGASKDASEDDAPLRFVCGGRCTIADGGNLTINVDEAKRFRGSLRGGSGTFTVEPPAGGVHFQVDTPELSVVVQGTIFTVRVFPGTGTTRGVTEVSVERGAVTIQSLAGVVLAQLRQGDAAFRYSLSGPGATGTAPANGLPSTKDGQALDAPSKWGGQDE